MALFRRTSRRAPEASPSDRPKTDPPAGPRDRLSKEDLLPIALFLGLLLFVFRDFVFTGRVFFQRDTTLVEIPVKKLTVRLLKEGHFALWTDAHGNGQPFLANPKNAVFYPTTWLYLVLPLFASFKLHYLVHIIFGWLGLYVLCGSYALSRRASFLGASLFAFSGMYLSSLNSTTTSQPWPGCPGSSGSCTAPTGRARPDGSF